MDDKTALEDLQYIRKVIEDSKRTMAYNGMDYIFWGILVIIGMLLMYILILNHVFFNYLWIWLGLVSIGWAYSFFNKTKYYTDRPRTFTTRVASSVWLASGIAMTILGFVGPLANAFQPMFISPVLSVVLGIAYFITGYIFESRWFSYLSFGWWTGGIVLFFYPGIHSLLIMALMMLFFQTIPGIIMFRKYKKEVAI
ncbi:MAG: hypothetical protein ACM3S2_07325 [Ignavibacteriales bacterium]